MCMVRNQLFKHNGFINKRIPFEVMQKLLGLRLLLERSTNQKDQNISSNLIGCKESHWFGTSLVVQWLRLRTPNAGGLGLVPGRGTRSRMPQLKTPHAPTKRSHVPQLKDPACRN